jgi:hypothetical protein
LNGLEDLLIDAKIAKCLPRVELRGALRATAALGRAPTANPIMLNAIIHNRPCVRSTGGRCTDSPVDPRIT